jgi:hypothetical protein
MASRSTNRARARQNIMRSIAEHTKKGRIRFGKRSYKNRQVKI